MRLIDADALIRQVDYEIGKIDRKLGGIFAEGMDYVKKLIADQASAKQVPETITNEDAIDQLRRTGWLQEHDRDMASGDLAGIINRIMEGHDKSISVSIYPWEEEKNDNG